MTAKKTKTPKKTMVQLKKENAFLNQRLGGLFQEIQERDNRIHALEKQLQLRVDTAMLDARNKLAYSLGQMTEAISKAITVIVGKEVM